MVWSPGAAPLTRSSSEFERGLTRVASLKQQIQGAIERLDVQQQQIDSLKKTRAALETGIDQLNARAASIAGELTAAAARVEEQANILNQVQQVLASNPIDIPIAPVPNPLPKIPNPLPDIPNPLPDIPNPLPKLF